MFSLLRQELSWLIGTLVVGGIFGLIIGYPALSMLVFCFAYACWLLWRITRRTDIAPHWLGLTV